MRRKLVVYQQDVLDAIEAIGNFCKDKTFEEYEGSLLLRSAVERQFEIIGEAIRQMEQFFPGSTDQIPDSPKAKALRNHLAHGYFTIDQGELWQIVQNDLPTLRTEMAILISANAPFKKA